MGPIAKTGKAADVLNPWGWVDLVKDSNSIGLRELLKAYRISGYVECPYKRRRLCKCKKNPHCLWGLGENAWKQEETGTETERSQSRDEGEIVGLQNLGATCYVNSLLQLWYHNPIVRPAILRWKPPACTIVDPHAYAPLCAVSHVQAMFARMKASKQKSIDTKSLVAALELDAGLQQDAQEFSKLLLACITRQLENSDENTEISSIFKTCFTGESLFETTCENCRTVTLGRKEEFNELQLSVLQTLNESFQDYFKEERLEGDNQYFCNVCDTKQNAIRKVRILKLPQVLNIQLMRFIFDTATLDKKKVMRNIHFPEILDMTDYLDSEPNTTDNAEEPVSKERLIYHLNAVLIHNGKKASSGHYISHIRDIASGGWFECNDDRIEKIHTGFSETLVMKNEGEEAGECEQQVTKGTPVKSLTSKGAYMLVYTREKYFTNVQADPDLHDFLLELIKREDMIVEADYEDKKKAKGVEILKRAQRQNEIDLLYKCKYPLQESTESSSAQKENEPNDTFKNDNKSGWINTSKNSRASNLIEEPMDVDPAQLTLKITKVDSLDFISTEWLELWLEYQLKDLPPIDNKNITCRHGKLKPPRKNELNTLYKIIPSEVAKVLYEAYNKPGEGQRLSAEAAMCRECVKSHCELLHAQMKLEADARKVIESVKKCDDDLEKLGGHLTPHFHGTNCLIGKDSLKEWKKHAKIVIEDKDRDEDIQILNNVNELKWILNHELRCVHKNLSVNRSIRKRIHVDVFIILCGYFPNAIWYGSGQNECEICLKTERENTVVVEQFKVFAATEKGKLNDLLKGWNRPTTSKSGDYCLVPTTFIHNWIHFIKNPISIENILNIPTGDLLCDACCDCLTPSFKYPFEFIQSVPELEEADVLENVVMLTQAELEILLEARSIDQIIEVNIRIDPNNPLKRIYTYNVGVCQKAAEEWREMIVAEKYVYEHGEITVRKLEDDDVYDLIPANPTNGVDEVPIPTKISRTENDLNGQPRRSERRRNNREEKTYRHINSSMRIREFQVSFIYNDFKACASDQHLYWNRRELTWQERELTFGELKIPVGSMVYLKIDKPMSNGEKMDVEEVTESRPPQVERGFSGTALLQSSFTPTPPRSTSHPPTTPPPPNSVWDSLYPDFGNGSKCLKEEGCDP